MADDQSVIPQRYDCTQLRNRPMPYLTLAMRISTDGVTPLLFAPSQTNYCVAHLPVYSGWTPEQQLAHAKRIVACVGFCAGTDSEFLDGAGNLGRMLAVGAAPSLLAACEEALMVLKCAISAGCDDSDTEAHALANHGTLQKLRSAISAAKGG